jgi:hypothetical protein
VTLEAHVIGFPVPSHRPAPRTRAEPERALLAGRPCPGCGAPLTGRKREACSPRCRAALSRRRLADAQAARIWELEEMVRALGGDPGDRPGGLRPAPVAQDGTPKNEAGPSADGGDQASWRFRVSPPGRRFGWRGQVYASDRRTGELVTKDAEFATALRQRADRDMVEELR